MRKIRKDIAVFLLPVSKWKSSIDDSYDGCCGFFLMIREGKDMMDAFLCVRDKLTLPESVKGELYAFFSDFGRSYVKDELLKLDGIISTLSEAEKRMQEEVKNDSRAVKALIIAVALGLVILLI